MPLCCPSAAPPDSRGLLVPGECCTCFRPSTVPGEAAELFSLLLLFNFGSACRAAKVKFKEGFAVVPISSQVTLPLRPGSEPPVPALLPAGLLADVCLHLFQSKHASVSHHLLPAETLPCCSCGEMQTNRFAAMVFWTFPNFHLPFSLGCRRF